MLNIYELIAFLLHKFNKGLQFNRKERGAVKKGIGERIEEMTEIPKDYIMNMPRTTLVGNKEVYVDNYSGLIEYTDEIIRLSVKKGILLIKGTDLTITRITELSIYIGGNILSVEFTQGKK